MKNTTEILDSFASILTYPSEDYKERVARCTALIADSTFGSGDAKLRALTNMEEFKFATKELSIADLEEFYTRTFDINPVSSLEVGWHLHGETYERGAFLVTMRDVLRQCSIEESSELPDHLTHALLAVGRMSDEEAAEFVSTRLLKAMDKMLEGFSEKENPYEHVLQAIKILLKSKYHVMPSGVEI
jgi:nitrate reductase delta subunit